jgi:hypothetical protein
LIQNSSSAHLKPQVPLYLVYDFSQHTRYGANY